MIRDRNIVCVASNWFEHPTGKHHVMRALAAHNHVVWVNYHASRRPQLNRGDARMVFRRLGAAWAGARRVQPTIDVLSPLVLPVPESRVARAINVRLIVRQIRRALRRLPERPIQLWLFTPDAPELIRPLAPEKVVYCCVDDFAAFSGYNPGLIAKLEQMTFAAADAVLTTSAPLQEHCRRYHSNAHLVPHGVDFEHFAATEGLSPDRIPNDLRGIRPPVFGYFGLISDYVDLELIAAAARRRPEWSFVLIGSVRSPVNALNGLPNVHLLGGKPYEDLPRYCRGFDVGLIPFRMNRLTHAVNPIKLREYLAAGLPVVASPMPEVLRYAPAVRTAETLDEFLAACAAALGTARGGGARSRRELVRGESWQARVDQVSQIIMRLDREQPSKEPSLATAG